MLMNSFFKSQFSYCPLVQRCHCRTIHNKINYLRERCLRVIYIQKISSFKELLESDRSALIHSGNLQILVIEILKVYNNLYYSIFITRFLINEIQTTNYTTLRTFQFHLLEVYIMEIKAFRSQVLRFGILCQQS